MNPTKSESALTTVFIIDDHELLSATLRDMLNIESDFRVIGTACDGEGALEQLAKVPADIVLLDLVLPGLTGIEVAKKIVSLFPHTKIAVVSGVDSDAAIEMAFASGAHMFVEKRAKVDELLTALRMLRDGQCYLPERQARVLMESVRRRLLRKPLAAHDMSILRWLALSMSAKEIAAEEGVSKSCVYKARRRIAERVGASDAGRIQLVAARLGLVNQGLDLSLRAAVAEAKKSPTSGDLQLGGCAGGARRNGLGGQDTAAAG